jgi:hypothetical protein
MELLALPGEGRVPARHLSVGEAHDARRALAEEHARLGVGEQEGGAAVRAFERPQQKAVATAVRQLARPLIRDHVLAGRDARGHGTTSAPSSLARVKLAPTRRHDGEHSVPSRCATGQ